MTKLTKLIIIIVVIMLAYLTSLAQDCSNPQTQTDLNFCAKAKYDYSDKKLNEMYQLVQKKLSKTGKEKLKNAEFSWLKYRDTHCDAEIDRYQGGSIVNLIKYECLTKLTEQRIKVLQEFYDSIKEQEGNR